MLYKRCLFGGNLWSCKVVELVRANRENAEFRVRGPLFKVSLRERLRSSLHEPFEKFSGEILRIKRRKQILTQWLIGQHFNLIKNNTSLLKIAKAAALKAKCWEFCKTPYWLCVTWEAQVEIGVYQSRQVMAVSFTLEFSLWIIAIRQMKCRTQTRHKSINL